MYDYDEIEEVAEEQKQLCSFCGAIFGQQYLKIHQDLCALDRERREVSERRASRLKELLDNQV